MSDRLVLRTALGKHDHVKALKDRRVQSDRVELQFVDFQPLPEAFRHIARGGDLDLTEMAVVTHLLAHHFGKPLTALAIPLWSRLPHTNLVCPADSDLAGPEDLAGRKVGVRAYAQTSGVWVRGVLQSEYGLDLDGVTWVTMEDAHLLEYQDPPNAVRNRSSQGLRPLMMAGELAAIMGEREVDPNAIRPVIPDAEAAAREWVRRTGISPVNHVVAVQSRLLTQHPWLPQELMRMFAEARELAVAEGAEPPQTYGLEANRPALQALLDYSAQQRITPRRYDVDELFHPL